MMSVMEDMDVHQSYDNEPEPTWEQAVAEFDAAEPAELVRPLRKVVIVYRFTNGRVHATSPDLTGFEVTGPTLYETKKLVRADLATYLDPAVELDEREPTELPSEGTSRSWLTHGPGQRATTTASANGLILVSKSRVRALPWK